MSELTNWLNKLPIKDNDSKKLKELLQVLENAETTEQFENIAKEIKKIGSKNKIIDNNAHMDYVGTTDALVDIIASKMEDSKSFDNEYEKFKKALKEYSRNHPEATADQSKQLIKILGPMAGAIIISLLLKIPIIPLVHGMSHTKPKKKESSTLSKVAKAMFMVNGILILISLLMNKGVPAAIMTSQGIWTMVLAASELTK